jgi:hypothetical protein
MVNALKKIPLVFLGAIFILGLSLHLLPCIFCHDDGCEDSTACDSPTCQCSCSISATGTMNHLPIDDPGPSHWLAPIYSSHKLNDLSFEFYRPPERRSS